MEQLGEIENDPRYVLAVPLDHPSQTLYITGESFVGIYYYNTGFGRIN